MNFPLWPDAASQGAHAVDRLFIGLVVVCGLMSIAVFAGIAFFAIRYRTGTKVNRITTVNTTPIEIGWTAATTIAFLAVFAFGVGIYFDDFRAPANALDIFVVGKQWMWKVEHPGGQREIDELHVPLGRAVRLTFASEDVIHDFFIPAFRIKRDVVPGMYTQMTFTPTSTGTFHIFCSQYCGTQHAGMIGRVVVVRPADYERWLSGGAATKSMVQAGAEVFRQHGCDACHLISHRGPALEGLPGRVVHFRDGSSQVADDNYIRTSILAPATKVVAGYDDIMPSFQGQLSESELLELVAYIKSMGKETQP